MSTYKLEFDVPYSELSEFGYCKSKVLKQEKSLKSFNRASGLWIEPHSGTVGLRTVQSEADGMYTGQVALEDIDYAAGYWDAHPISVSDGGSLLASPTINRSKLGSGSIMDLLEITTDVAELALNGITLMPFMQSQTTYPANQPFWFEFETHLIVADEYLSIMFGDFLLSLHAHQGYAELHWSEDGSREPESWIWRRHIATISAHDLVESCIGSGGHVANRVRVRIHIIPMGRGLIYFGITTAGSTVHDLYTHYNATWNAEDEQYDITAPGKLILWTNKAQAKNFSMTFGPLTYVTSGTWTDHLTALPYAPTTTPEITSSWSKTSGTPTLAATLLDENGIEFDPDGTNDKCKVEFEFAGDGTCSPWLDMYHLVFPEKVIDYNPTLITITQDYIKSLSIEDSENWDDQRLTIVLKDDGTNADIAAIAERSEINCRLSIDDVPYMVAMMVNPKREPGKSFDKIILTGRNFGMHKLAKKKYFHAPPFDGKTHPDVIRWNLRLAGFADEDIVTDTDTLSLPAPTTTQGKTTLKYQPPFNSPMREFLELVSEKFSRWPLHYDADMVWRYEAPEVLTPTSTPVVTFFKEREDVTTGNSYCATPGPTIEIEPPECNVLYMFGLADDQETVLGVIATYPDGISYDTTPLPVDYIGCIESVIYIDTAINDFTILSEAAEKIFNAASHRIKWVTWKAPFVSSVKVRDAVMVEDVGLVQLSVIGTEADTIERLENLPSTTYRGKLIETGVDLSGVFYRGERAKLVKGFSEKAARKTGTDPDPASQTTDQKKQIEMVTDKIMRGEVEWTTPIVRTS